MGGREQWDARLKVPATSIPRLARHLASERRTLGDSDPFLRQQYLCEFSSVVSSGLFDVETIEKALGRNPDDEAEVMPGFGGPTRRRVMGIDFAARVDDTCISYLVGRTFTRFELLPHGDEMGQVARIMIAIGKFRPQEVVVDEIGVGGAVVSRLAEILRDDPRKIRVTRYNAAKAARRNDLFSNAKTEISVGARKALIDGTLGLPSRESDPPLVDRLVKEMLGVQLVERPDGRSRVQDPPDSPDVWDAALCALAGGESEVEVRKPGVFTFELPAWF